MRVSTECPHCGKNTRIDLTAETTTQKCHHCGLRLSAVPTGWERIKKKRTFGDEEDGGTWSDHSHAAARKISPLLGASLGLAGLGIVGGLAYYAVKNRGSSTETSRSIISASTQITNSEIDPQTYYDYVSKHLPEAKRIAEAALSAATLDQLRPHLDNEAALTPERLAKYHTPEGRLPLPLGLKKILPINQTIYLPTEKTIIISYIDLKGKIRTLPLRERGGGSLKIDWPAFVAENPESLGDYAKKPSGEPKTFRVILKRDNYFNLDFNEEQKYYCFRLEDPYTQDVIYGYVPINGPMDEISRHLHQTTSPVRVMVSIRFPKIPSSQNQVEITEFIHDKWIMP